MATKTLAKAEIKNESNTDDLVTVSESHKKGLVRLEIGEASHNRRHANLSAVEATALAHALLSYAALIAK